MKIIGKNAEKWKFSYKWIIFTEKISIPGWKSQFVKNHEKHNNSSPDCPIWLIFRYVGPYNQWNRFWCQNFDIFSQYRSKLTFLAKIQRFFTENKAWYTDFPVKIIHISLNFHFSAFFAMNLCFGLIYSLLWPYFGWISAIFGSFLHRALNRKSAIFWTYLGPLEWL